MQSYRIHVGDKVMVIKGKDAGKIGAVTRILPKKNAVIVEKVNMARRHTRANPYTKKEGGIFDKDMPIPISNVMFVCDSCAKASRVGYKFIDENGKKKKVRFCKKCNEVITDSTI